MTSLLKNFIIVLLAMLMGAATVVGYLRVMPPDAPVVAGATTAVASSRQSIFDEEMLVSIYDRVSPSVVNVTTREQARRPAVERLPQIPGFPRVPQLPSPQEPPLQGAGSGVVIDDQGHVLTNNHVVDGASRVDVTLSDGEMVEARVLGRDPGNDLALLKIDVDRSRLTPATLGDSEKLKAGQMAIAIGNPFGLSRTITVGIISSVGRTYASASSARPIRNMIQTDAAINPGNSGGPLLNSAGEVVGITTAIESPVRGSVGVGFAVPINTATLYLEELKAGKAISHPWLGISGAPVTSSVARELDVPAEGVYVMSVVADSPAEKAGLKGAVSRGTRVQSGTTPKGGDIILAVDGRKVNKVEEISSYLDTKKPGDTVTVNIRRGGETRDLSVALAEWPESIEEQ